MIIIRKEFAYVAITLMAFLSTSSAYAQSYSYGTGGNGITWGDIQSSALNKGIPGTLDVIAATAAVNQINGWDRTYLVENNVLSVADENAITNSLITAAEESGVTASEATGVRVVELGSTAATDLVESSSGVGAVVASAALVYQVVWPSDINWAIRGFPMICANSSVSTYPNCYAYYVPVSSSNVSINWQVIDPSQSSFLGQITQYFLKVSIGLEDLLGTPNPSCALQSSVTNSSQSIGLTGSKSYNLQPGESYFTITCFTAGANAATTILDNIGNGLSIIGQVIGNAVTSAATSLWDLLTGQTYVQSKVTINTQAYPVPQNIIHKAGIIIGVNSPPPPPKVVIPAPTLTFSANPTSVVQTQSSTLSWSATNATTCYASGGWGGAKAISGSATVTPPSTTAYSLYCQGPGGSSGTQSVTVGVIGSPGVDIKAQAQ